MAKTNLLYTALTVIVTLIIGGALILIFSDLKALSACTPQKHWQDLLVLDQRKHVVEGQEQIFYGMDNNVVYRVDKDGFQRGDRVEVYKSTCSDTVEFKKIGYVDLK